MAPGPSRAGRPLCSPGLAVPLGTRDPEASARQCPLGLGGEELCSLRFGGPAADLGQAAAATEAPRGLRGLIGGQWWWGLAKWPPLQQLQDCGTHLLGLMGIQVGRAVLLSLLPRHLHFSVPRSSLKMAGAVPLVWGRERGFKISTDSKNFFTCCCSICAPLAFKIYPSKCTNNQLLLFYPIFTNLFTIFLPSYSQRLHFTFFLQVLTFHLHLQWPFMWCPSCYSSTSKPHIGCHISCLAWHVPMFQRRAMWKGETDPLLWASTHTQKNNKRLF